MIALLIIPESKEQYNRKKYISACMKDVVEQGYLPLCHDAINYYVEISHDLFTFAVLKVCDKVFVYTDFGKDMPNIEGMEVIEKTLKDRNKYRPELDNILEEVAGRTGISVCDLKSRSRARELCDARFVYFRRSRELTTKSLSAIGALVNRDHATVLYGSRAAAEVKDIDELYNKIFNY